MGHFRPEGSGLTFLIMKGGCHLSYSVIFEKCVRDINRLIITPALRRLTRGESSVDGRSNGKRRMLKTRGRTAHSTLRKRQGAEDVGSLFLATVAASAQTFSFFLLLLLSLFPSGAALTHINLLCYTHQR